jgi:hypothetical protein
MTSTDGYNSISLSIPTPATSCPGQAVVASWADQRRSKGKRGGLRLIYYHLVKDGQIWLLTLYTKGEVADLSARERRLLKVAIEDEVRQRAHRRRPKGR